MPSGQSAAAIAQIIENPIRNPAENDSNIPKVLGTTWSGSLQMCLTGDHRRHFRQSIMSALMGDKVPAAKCGITAMSAEFYRRANIAGDCPAVRAKEFTKFCQEQMAC